MLRSGNRTTADSARFYRDLRTLFRQLRNYKVHLTGQLTESHFGGPMYAALQTHDCSSRMLILHA